MNEFIPYGDDEDYTPTVLTEYGKYSIGIRNSKRLQGYVAWAKEGTITGFCPLTEPGDRVYFEFGRTLQEAKEKMIAALPKELQ